jgi:predicted Zn finger-like uncharacterized protein
MSLATRCPQCQTVFRVVQDQLRVSEGWVRCGRCTEVFNAAQHLVDPATGHARRAPIELRSGLPAAAQPTSPGHGGQDGTPESSDSTQSTEAPAAAGGGLRARSSERPDFEPTLVPENDAIFWSASEDLDIEIDRASGMPASGPDAPAAPAVPGRAQDGTPGDDRRAEASLPSFVRRAQRAERWRRPGMRLLLGVGVLTATFALLAQGLYVYRDAVAARWPQARPSLAQACATLGCRIEALRAIDALVVDSSTLVRVEQSDLYRLSVALRNQRELEVALPALDLSLTDLQGRLIARRVLRAGDLGAQGLTLPARGELALQATLQVAAAPVAGYTIEIFYP